MIVWPFLLAAASEVSGSDNNHPILFHNVVTYNFDNLVVQPQAVFASGLSFSLTLSDTKLMVRSDHLNSLLLIGRPERLIAAPECGGGDTGNVKLGRIKGHDIEMRQNDIVVFLVSNQKRELDFSKAHFHPLVRSHCLAGDTKALMDALLCQFPEIKDGVSLLVAKVSNANNNLPAVMLLRTRYTFLHRQFHFLRRRYRNHRVLCFASLTVGGLLLKAIGPQAILNFAGNGILLSIGLLPFGLVAYMVYGFISFNEGIHKALGKR